MKKLTLILLILFSINLPAQAFKESHSKIRASIDDRDYQTAIEDLERTQISDKKSFELNNFDYLLARLLEKQGDFSTATVNYQSVVDRNSILSEYALWHLAEISRATGNLFLERMYLRELLLIAPESLINDASKSRLARSLFESKDFDSAVLILRANVNFSQKVSDETNPLNDVFGKLIVNDRKSREDLIFLGNAYFHIGDANGAREVFTKLVEKAPNASQPDDFALEGVKGLDKLDVGSRNLGKVVPDLSEVEQLKRANIYQFNRDFSIARLHYQSLIGRFPKSPNTPVAMYQIGRGFMQERNFSDAANWFERIREQFPESSVAKDALNQSAAANAGVRKTKEAVSRYQELIGIDSDGANIVRAYLNIVDIMRDNGEIANALKWTAKTREDFRGQIPEALAIFAQARIHIAQKDWQNALADLDSLRFLGNLGGSDVPGGTNKAEIEFLTGYVLEQLNRWDEAIDWYLSVPDGRNSYYGWRATERLRALAKSEPASKFVAQKYDAFRAKTFQNISGENADSVRQAAQSAIRLLRDSPDSLEGRSENAPQKEILLNLLRETYEVLPEYKNVRKPKLIEAGSDEIRAERDALSGNFRKQLAEELLFLGLYDEGTPELELAWRNDQKALSEDQKYSLAVNYMRGDMANRAIEYIEPIWRKIPADYQIELIPKEQLSLLYPRPYADSLLKFAPPRNVDPRFVLSVMRQESRFQANITSASSARGLMQFISSTSNQIAGELGKEHFKQSELYHPPTAILFGSGYLSGLFHKFPGQPQAVAASYNAGEENMARWFARADSNDPDVYVPEIRYAESKDYVYKVMANYRIYRMIYDENLNALKR